jgi:hypothetical protein
VRVFWAESNVQLSTTPFFSLSDGNTVEIRVGADGKTLHIRDNHAVDERVDESSAQDGQ